MSKNDDFSMDNTDDAEDAQFAADELKRQITAMSKKLNGKNSEPITNNEILLFLRVINYNFVSLTKLLQTVLVQTIEMDTTLSNLESSNSRMAEKLQQFVETDSMLDDIMKGDSDGSSSTSN